MRILRSLLISLTLISGIYGQDAPAEVPKEKHNYQSDVARLRKIVINSLYSHREVFLRELLSNANDALEKLRLTALTDKQAWDGSEPLNVTIKAIKDEDGPGGCIVITDTGIGMGPDELATNLGTLAKSGTTEFLQKAESSDGTGTGNLIGAFGLGFYSSFLVADRVFVSSIPPPSSKNPSPSQYVFSSSAEESSFEVYPDPRGNTLGHGTEITLVLKDDSLEYLDTVLLGDLVNKHSVFSTAFPIYLFEQRTEEVVDEEATEIDEEASEPESDFKSVDEDEAVVEEVEESTEEPKEKEVKMKTIVVDEWKHLNPLPPIWMRDPKDVTEEEYKLFYKATFKDLDDPLAWHHFSGDSGSGTSFKAIIYLPGSLVQNFWQQAVERSAKDIRLMVKRVFITSDLGDEPLPKWASVVKAVVDADDLPLNVSRETLQHNRFLKQVKQIIMKRLIQLFAKLSEDDPEKFEKVQEIYGTVIKLGAIENSQNRDKLSALARFNTNQRNMTSLDQYVENRKQGQKQIFYLADIGKPIEVLKKSVFIEKLDARGYEVLLLNEPLDEVLFTNLNKWQKLPFQDVAKAGLKFGDEDKDAEDEKEYKKEMAEKFKPLLAWMKEQAGGVVRDVVISNRLVTSPVAIVADMYGITANVEKLMNAATKKQAAGQDFMAEFAKKQKLLEVNPKSPLIEGLLHRIEALPEEAEDRDVDEENELKEVAAILIDGALVRSGFEVPDSNEFFNRVDRALRRSLGVSESAKTDATVKPAPPVDPEPPQEDVMPDFSSFPEFTDMFPDRQRGEQVVMGDDILKDIKIEVEPEPEPEVDEEIEVSEEEEPVTIHDEL